MRTDLGRHF